jgi:hypothetical protein
VSCRWLVGATPSQIKGHTLFFEIVGVMAHLPCYLTTPGGLTLLTCGLGPPFTLSEVLHDLGGKKAEAPSMPRIIPGVGFKLSLRFSSMV